MKSSHLFIIYFLSRIPFLFNGFGLDPDSWRVVEYGLTFIENGKYIPSRYPGYPLYELIIYNLSNKSPLITNGISAISGFLCLITFKNILESSNIYSKSILFPILFLFCFNPSFWIASVSTMDYLIAEFLLLLSWYLVKTQKNIIYSAIVLGLSIGARPNYVIFILPLLIGAIKYKKNHFSFKSVFIYSVTCIITACITFIPVFNWGISSYPSQLLSGFSILAFGFNSIRLFGVLGTICLVIIHFNFAIRFKKNKILINSLFSDPSSIMSFLGIILNVFLFALFPEEPYYLIPSIPFSLFLLAKTITLYQGRLIKISLLFFPVILFFSNFTDIKFWEKNSSGVTSFSKPYIGEGLLYEDYNRRKSILKQCDFIFENNFKKPCILIGGWHVAIIRAYGRYFKDSTPTYVGDQSFKFDDCDCKIVQVLDKNQLTNELNSNNKIFYTEAAETQTKVMFDFNISSILSSENLLSRTIEK